MEPAPSSIPVDVFGSVEPLRTPNPGDPIQHIREASDSSPPTSPLFTPTRIVPARAASRRTQSVGGALAPRQPVVPSPLGPARRKRGEREAGHERKREKDTLRAELDASAAVAPGLALDPRIASDVLDLERRFAAASKGKSPLRPPRTHTHRSRYSLPANRTDLLSPPSHTHAVHRANSPEQLAPLAESGAGMTESDTSGGDVNGTALASTTVGPASPSSAILPAVPNTPSSPKSGPSPTRIDKPAYSSLLPNSDPEHASASALDAKRSKRASLTAMFGINRKKDKDPRLHEKESDQAHSPPRPIPIRVDTHHTTRTVVTTHTSATAGSEDRGSGSGVVLSGSPMDLSPGVEPSAKTLARAAATRDQLARRYAILYAGIGGGDGGSMVSGSGSGSGSARGSKARGTGANLLDVIRWRSRKSQIQSQTRNAAEYERTDEAWEREVERRIRDYPPTPMLGDSLPEATSLSWLPYLEPVFAEERGMTEEVMGVGMERRRSMTAWYVLASFVEDYISASMEENKSINTPRPLADLSPHAKITSDVRAQAILNAANARGARAGTGTASDTNESPGTKFGIMGALRTRSRQSSAGVEPGLIGTGKSTGIGSGTETRSRQGSVGIGTTSEPASPSHITGYKRLAPATGDVRAGRAHSGSSQIHSRSQSQARSISAGNGGSGSIDWGSVSRPGQIGLGDSKSMSPSSSRMNLANFIVGGAAMLGLGLNRRRQPGANGEGVMSGSENESAGVSSDVIPSDADVRIGVGIGRGGISDGECGRTERRKKTGREGEKGSLSDGGRSGSGERDLRRRSRRPNTTVWVPVEVHPQEKREAREKIDREKDEQDGQDYERKKLVADDAHDALAIVDMRLQSFVQLANELNVVHMKGSDIFGEMFVAIPPSVVSTLTPDLAEEDGTLTRTPTATSPLTPTLTQHTSLGLDTLSAFAHRLEGEEKPIVVDAIGRSKLDANLPIKAFEVLHTLDHRLKDISNRVGDLRRICENAEQEQRVVKALYECTAESVETTYPECTQIERLLSSMVTEDMPWLPSWLPLWLRHLLEIFSNQIQFLVENGLRIYGYIYQIASVIVFLFTIVLGATFILGRFVRNTWWVFAVAGISVLAYLMTRPPEEMLNLVERGL
ncbi:hypothetical protein FRC10_006814 [Ceratobasidium sp. 414]|nr:hypothetical protein FRC10_006814 [Ceratobasidium sp. 414]